MGTKWLSAVPVAAMIALGLMAVLSRWAMLLVVALWTAATLVRGLLRRLLTRSR